MGNVKSQQDSADWHQLLTSRDGISGTYDILMTYIINHLILPSQVREIVEECEKVHTKEIAATILFNNTTTDSNITSLASGSRMEGLRLPDEITVNENGHDQPEESDRDVLWIHNTYMVYPSLDEAVRNGGSLYMDRSQTQPGFATVRIREPGWSVSKKLITKRVQHGKEVLYMGKLMPELWKMMKNETLSGPAVPYDMVGEMQSLNIREHPKQQDFPIHSPHDLVYALRVSKWPEFMQRWIDRQKKPIPADLYELFQKGIGCLVVAAAHRNSKDPAIEFRISCSVPELLYARNLTDIQRQVYMAFKYLVKETVRSHKGIMTYHLKTTLFWTVEQSPSDVWKDNNLAKGLYLLLDNFIGFLAQGYLPNYFLPESNLLSHLTADHINAVLRLVVKIREDPVGNLLRHQKNKRLAGHCLGWNHSFLDILRPYLTKASEILEYYARQPSTNLIMLFVQLGLECEANLHANRIIEMRSENVMMRKNITMNNSPINIERNNLCTNLYVVWKKATYRALVLMACDEDTIYACGSLTRNLKNKIEGISKHWLFLLEATWNKMLASCTENLEEADMRWDQSAVACDTFQESLQKLDIISITGYSCFFYELLTKRFNSASDDAKIKQAANSLMILDSLVSKMEDQRTRGMLYKEYIGVWKDFSLNIDNLDPDITRYLEFCWTASAPHEIVGLVVNILTVRKVLVPSLRSKMETHHISENPPETSSSTGSCNHSQEMWELVKLKDLADETLSKAQDFLKRVVFDFNSHFNTMEFQLTTITQNRQESRKFVNFLLALTLLHAGQVSEAENLLLEIGYGSFWSEKKPLFNPSIDMYHFGNRQKEYDPILLKVSHPDGFGISWIQNAKTRCMVWTNGKEIIIKIGDIKTYHKFSDVIENIGEFLLSQFEDYLSPDKIGEMEKHLKDFSANQKGSIT